MTDKKCRTVATINSLIFSCSNPYTSELAKHKIKMATWQNKNKNERVRKQKKTICILFEVLGNTKLGKNSSQRDREQPDITNKTK